MVTHLRYAINVDGRHVEISRTKFYTGICEIIGDNSIHPLIKPRNVK